MFVKMYASKTFDTIRECLEFANENKYEIISIIPKRYEPSYCDCYRADLYEIIYR